MSLSSLAPTEKTEHLIYSLLPISFATWCASLLNTGDPFQILAAIISISSFGTLILYEFTPEQWIIDEFLRRRARRRESLKEAILIFSMMIRVWNYEPTRPEDWSEDYIDEQGKTQVSITVSGPYIRKRVWRIRASVYLFISTYFIFGAFWKYLDSLLQIDGVLDHLPEFASGIVSILHQEMVLIIISILFLITIGVFLRHRNLLSNIDQLSRYNHLRKLMSLQKLRVPEYFAASKEQGIDEIGRPRLNYLTLATELDTLMDFLTIGNWSNFFHGWDRIYLWIHREVVRLSEGYLAFDLMSPFVDVYRGIRGQDSGYLVNLSEIVNASKLKLDWVCYFIKKCEEIKEKKSSSGKLLKLWKSEKRNAIDKVILTLPEFDNQLLTLQEKVCGWSEAQIQEPDTLLDVSANLSTIMREGTQAAIMWAVSQLKEEIKAYTQGAERGLRFLIEELQTDPLKTKLQPETIVRVILRGFQDGGVGYSVSISHHEALKNLKKYCPSNMENEWEKALAYYIRRAEKDALRKLLDDRGFLEEPSKNRVRIRSALSDQKEKFKDDRQVVSAFRRYL